MSFSVLLHNRRSSFMVTLTSGRVLLLFPIVALLVCKSTSNDDGGVVEGFHRANAAPRVHCARVVILLVVRQVSYEVDHGFRAAWANLQRRPGGQSDSP